MPITRSVLERAEQLPDQPAIVGAEGSLSYADLVADSRRVFAAVDELHRTQLTPPTPASPPASAAPATPASPPASAAPPTPASPPASAPEARGIPITAVSVSSAFHTARIIAALAGYRAISATIDPLWPLEHQVRVILATGIGVVISDSAPLADSLAARGWTGTLVGLEEFLRREREATPAGAPMVRVGDEPFLLLFSSGTTSSPKAFLKTRQQYRENYAVSRAHLEPLPGVATLAPGPVSYSLTLYALIECLASGGSAHMADAFDAVQLAHRVRAEAITRIVAVPAVVQAIVDGARRDPAAFATLELVVTGGANLPASLRARLGEVLPNVRLISYYGAAEIGFIGDSRDGDGTGISLYEGIEASIRDTAGRALPDGQLGTLWIRAAACSDGYLSGTTDAVLRSADGWATVNDQARLDGRVLELAGRAGDVIVTGGHKVSLTDVERAFDGFPGLGVVCAVALPHARLGTVVALVVEGESPDKRVLQAHAREHLAPQFVPRRWYRVAALPRTVGGKVRRAETTGLVASGKGVERL